MSKTLNLNGWNAGGKTVLMRVDFNVPLDGERNITDETRILASLPSIKRIVAQGGKLILMSHLGRPKGKIDPAFSLRPVADRLGDLLDCPVKFAVDTVGPDARAKAAGLHPGEVLLLENLRFNPGETTNDPGFARALGELADCYVNDAFGTAHRAHASTVGVVEHFGGGRAGLLMEKELEHLGALLSDPGRPFVAILGGAKVSGKVEVILNLLDRVDTLLLGGGMVFTFFKEHGLNVGTSLVDDESMAMVREITARAKQSRAKLMLPEDCIVASEFNDKASKKTVLVTDIAEGWMGLDIGPVTIKKFTEVVAGARAIFWNGPMGAFEMDAFSRGTMAMVQKVASSHALTIVGGGDTDVAVHRAGASDNISYISTGGGAFLMLMEGKELPGVVALEAKV